MLRPTDPRGRRPGFVPGKAATGGWGKNALFYKSGRGATVEAILQSLIETSRPNGVSAWEYLLTLTRNRSEARANPAAYLPWSYAREEPGN